MEKPDQQFQLKWKAVALVMIMVCASVLCTAYAVGSGSDGNSIPVVIESGSGVETASYIIYKDGDYTCAKNGTTGRIIQRSLNDSDVIQTAVDATVESGGGSIHIVGGNYTLTNTINFTMANQDAFALRMDPGANISASGLPVMFDFTGADGCIIDGGVLLGDEDDAPGIGILFARDNLWGSGRHRITNTMVNGSFSIAGIYNYCSEENRYMGVTVYNVHPNASALVIAEYNADSVASPFAGNPYDSTMTLIDLIGCRLVYVPDVATPDAGQAIAMYGDIRDAHVAYCYLHSKGLAKVSLINNNGSLAEMAGPVSIIDTHAEGASNHSIYINANPMKKLSIERYSDGAPTGMAFYMTGGSLYDSLIADNYIYNGNKSLYVSASILNSEISGLDYVQAGTSIIGCDIDIAYGNRVLYGTSIYGSIIRSDVNGANRISITERTMIGFWGEDYLTKTIASGAIAVEQFWQAVTTEGGAASDDLVTINGGKRGDVLLLRQAVAGKEIVVKHGTGNIRLDNTKDYAMNSGNDYLLLFYDGTAWYEIGRGSPIRYENYGTATIANGQTSIVVTHGLGKTPQQIVVTGTTADTSACWITSITATQFTINVGSAVGGDRSVYWHAHSYA